MILKYPIVLTFVGAVLALGGLNACKGGPAVDEKTALDTKIVRLGDTVVAEVGGTAIYLSDIEHAALSKAAIKPGTALSPKDPLFQKLLDELIDQRLLALEALRRSLDQNDETRRRLALARERILANVVVEKLLAEKVTDESVKRMYDIQRAQQEKTEQVRARHIVVETEKLANELKGLLDNGGDFRALAKEFSVDHSTNDLGGDLGYFSQNALEDPIASQAFGLQTGDISAPFKTKYGWHVLKTTDRRPMPRPELKTIRSEIVSFMTYEEIQKLLKTLRSTNDIQLKTGQAATGMQSSQEKPEKEKSKNEP